MPAVVFDVHTNLGIIDVKAKTGVALLPDASARLRCCHFPGEPALFPVMGHEFRLQVVHDIAEHQGCIFDIAVHGSDVTEPASKDVTRRILAFTQDDDPLQKEAQSTKKYNSVLASQGSWPASAQTDASHTLGSLK